jgi:hypothetical protein
MLYEQKLLGMSNAELAQERMNVERDALTRAQVELDNYERKDAVPGAAWLQKSGGNRHFVSGGACGCEHFVFRVGLLNAECVRRGMAGDAKCKHFYIQMATTPDQSKTQTNVLPQGLPAPTGSWDTSFGNQPVAVG